MSDEALLAVDAESRLRALQPSSFIVEAPAGAGKTELLTQRVLMLLARVEEPEEIVAISFTNKAAAEMRHRIVEALQRAAGGKMPSEAHKRITFDLATAALAAAEGRGWQLLAHPGRLRVTTIDAFCAGLARQMPVLSRFGAQPRTVEDARRHYDDAARRALAWLEEEGEQADAVARALAHVDNDAVKLAGLLADMLARRDQWLRHALQTRPARYAETALRELVTRHLARATQALPVRAQQVLMPVARFAAGNLPTDHAIAPLRHWLQALEVQPEALPLWRAVAALLLTDKDEPRKAVDVRLGLPKEAKEQKLQLLECLAALSATDVAALAQVRRLPDPAYAEEEWATVIALATLLKLAAGELWGVFHAAGEVDFVEVAARALQALGEAEAPTDLALSLDYRIRHLLVDEFQDTSPAQIELLQKLTADWQPDDGRSLFLVGDPMQSIYRFRKADVGLFLAAANNGIGTVPLQRLSLYRNNRSCTELVTWVNSTFKNVFPACDDAAAGAIAYRRFAAAHGPMVDAGVTVHGIVATKDDDGGELEAERLIAIIDAERAADPGRKIAVLVRARRHLEALVARIRSQRPDLRFTAVEVESLADRQPVQDLLALTKALYHRADRVNWLAILRAPWCGLRLADLHALAGDDFNATVWSLLNDAERVLRLSADGRARLDHLRSVLVEVLRQQGRQSPARWLMGAWLALGGPACLGSKTEFADCDAFFALIDKLDAAGRFSADELEKETARLFAAPDLAADGNLQFMTLHKSKGLEFDTVILPGLHRTTRPGDKPLMLWEEVILDGLEEHLIAAPLKKRSQKNMMTPYDYLAALESGRTGNEAARLLYVGATRAIRHLHLVGVANVNAKGDIKAPGNTFLDLLWPALANNFALPDRPAEVLGAAAPAFIPKLLRVAEPIRIDLPSRQVAAAEAEVGGGDESDMGNSLDALVGTLTHRYLEMMAREGLDFWPASRLTGLRGAMEVWLSQQGCGDHDAALAAQRVASMLATTLASDEGRWLLARHQSAGTELALAHADATGASLHVVDRTFVANGERWIVDYKTTSVAGDLAERAANYRPQLDRYASLFATDDRPPRLAIYFVANGRLIEVPTAG